MIAGLLETDFLLLIIWVSELVVTITNTPVTTNKVPVTHLPAHRRQMAKGLAKTIAVTDLGLGSNGHNETPSPWQRVVVESGPDAPCDVDPRKKRQEKRGQ